MPIVTLLGLAGNVLSILVLRSPGIDMKVSALACSVLPESWNFASKLGEPMRICMIGPQTKKTIGYQPFSCLMGISMGKWPNFEYHVGK